MRKFGYHLIIQIILNFFGNYVRFLILGRIMRYTIIMQLKIYIFTYQKKVNYLMKRQINTLKDLMQEIQMIFILYQKNYQKFVLGHLYQINQIGLQTLMIGKLKLEIQRMTYQIICIKHLLKDLLILTQRNSFNNLIIKINIQPELMTMVM